MPISIGRQRAEAGDLVVGDGDGVVIVPRWRVNELVAELPAVREKEAQMEKLVKSGATVPAWLEARLSEGVRYVDE